MTRLILALALLGMGAPVYAEDVGAVAAALTDEASECRYLLNLCRETDARYAETEKLDTKSTPPLKTKRDVEIAAAELRNSRDVMNRFYEAFGRVRVATRVIRAKHETAPACFKECKPIEYMAEKPDP